MSHQLPELPAFYGYARHSYQDVETYTADQMRAYAELAIASVKREPQWLPIESAPKEEVAPFLVLLPQCAKHEECVLQVSNFQGDMYPDYLGGMVDFDDRIVSAIGWMPLPPPLVTATTASRETE